MNNTLNTQETKWYSKPPFTFTGFIVFAFVVFFPLGVFLLWKSNKIKTGWKIAFTIVGAFFGLMSVFAIFVPETPEMVAQQRREDSLAHIVQLKTDSIETDKKQKEIARKKQKEIEEANKAELSKEPRIINSTNELKQRFNDFATSLTSQFDYRIYNIEITQGDANKGEVKNSFQYSFNDKIVWMGGVNKSDNSIDEITMIAPVAGQSYQQINDVMLMMLGIVATADPSIKPENRKDIFARLGMFKNKNFLLNAQAHVIQNGIKYYINASPEMGVWFGASVADKNKTVQ